MNRNQFLDSVDWDSVTSELEERIPGFSVKDSGLQEVKSIKGEIDGNWIDFEFSFTDGYPIANIFTERYIDAQKDKKTDEAIEDFVTKPDRVCDEAEYEEDTNRYKLTCVPHKAVPPTEEISEKIPIPKSIGEFTLNVNFGGGSLEDRLVNNAVQLKSRLDNEIENLQNTI